MNHAGAAQELDTARAEAQCKTEEVAGLPQLLAEKENFIAEKAVQQQELLKEMSHEEGLAHTHRYTHACMHPHAILGLNNSGEVVRLKLLVRGKQFITKKLIPGER